MTDKSEPHRQRYICSCCKGHHCETITDQGVPNCGCLHNSDIGALWVKASHTSAPAAQERINAVVRELEILNQKLEKMWQRGRPTNSGAQATEEACIASHIQNDVRKAIVLLQAGERK